MADAQLTTLSKIRQKDNFTDSDRQRISKACDATLENLAKAESPQARVKLLREFRNIWGDLSSLNFKDEYARILARQISARMQNDPGEGIMLALIAMKEYQHDRIISAMRAGLAHSFAPVRMIAAEGIRELWAKLPGAEVKPTIEALVQAGVKEKEWIVSREIYRALALAKKSPEIVTSLLKIFEARLEGFGKRSGWQAEVPALEYFDASLGDLDEPTRLRLIRDLARMLAEVIPQYILESTIEDTPVERFSSAHVLVDSAERLLVNLVKSREQNLPNLRRALQQGLQDGPEALQLELGNWVGRGDVPGVLNKAPYKVPIGGVQPKKSEEKAK